MSSSIGSSGSTISGGANTLGFGSSSRRLNKVTKDGPSGRSFAQSRTGRIQTWSKYTDNGKPLRLDPEIFGKKKMALVIPRRTIDHLKTQIIEPRRYGTVHTTDSVNIKDFLEPRPSYGTPKAPTYYHHCNLNLYRWWRRSFAFTAYSLTVFRLKVSRIRTCPLSLWIRKLNQESFTLKNLQIAPLSSWIGAPM